MKPMLHLKKLLSRLGTWYLIRAKYTAIASSSGAQILGDEAIPQAFEDKEERPE